MGLDTLGLNDVLAITGDLLKSGIFLVRRLYMI